MLFFPRRSPQHNRQLPNDARGPAAILDGLLTTKNQLGIRLANGEGEAGGMYTVSAQWHEAKEPIVMQDIFEFDNLDALHKRVKDLKAGETIEVKHTSLVAFAIINDLEGDERFKNFQYVTAKFYRQGDPVDHSSFEISRKRSLSSD